MEIVIELVGDHPTRLFVDQSKELTISMLSSLT